MNPQLSCGDALAVRKVRPPHSSTVLQVEGVRLPPTRLPRINLKAIRTLLLD